jgi:hypothetical protein
MTGLLAQLVVWLNGAANALGRVLLAPIGALPGWLSATLVATATGVLLLVVFKYTSNQRAIKRVRDDINADLYALKLFKDFTEVTSRAQGRMIVGGMRLMFHALVPILVMIVPFGLLMGQLALWYKSRPLRVGEEAVVTLKLDGAAGTSWPDVRLRPTPAADVAAGPVRVRSKREVCWRIQAREGGSHRLVFDVDGRPCEKDLAVGDGLMRTSGVRPGWDGWEILFNPGEGAFPPSSPVRSIAIDYPRRASLTSGSTYWLTDWTGVDSWVVYWFIVSFIAAFCFRRALGVHL